jgi:hypothetical protein
MLCFLYTIAIGSCLAVVGALIERVLPPRAPRRWLWCAVIVLSLTIPPVYQAQHAATVSASPMAENFWVQVSSFDATMMRLWTISSAILLLWGLTGLWRVARVAGFRTSVNVVDGVPVIVTEAAGPATVGLWRSRVLLPRWVLAMPAGQRRYVVRHEEEHRRAHDAQLLFLTSLLLILTPWNLALWWQLRRLSLAVEMDCDNRVVAALGDAPVYGDLLFRVAQATSRGPRLQPGFLGGAGTLEQRLKVMLAPARLPRVLRYILPVVAIGLLLVVLSTPHPVLESKAATNSSSHVHQR